MVKVIVRALIGMLAGVLAAIALTNAVRTSHVERAYALATAFVWIRLGAIVGLVGGGLFGFCRR